MAEINCEDHILNEKNKFITPKIIKKLLKKYGVNYDIKNFDLFKRAFTHKSYIKHTTFSEKTEMLLSNVEPIDPEKKNSTIPLQEKSYENIEFLGDSTIHHALTQYIYKKYDNCKDEGFMTQLRTKIEKGVAQSVMSRKLKLHRYALISRNIEINGGRKKNDNIAEDIFEAFIGALDEDSSYDEVVKPFIFNLIDREIDLENLVNTNDNYKDIIMRYFHMMGWGNPKYSNIKTIDPESPKRKFIMVVIDHNDDIIGQGIGSSKKAGEQEAALDAIIKMGINEEDIK